MSTPRKRKPRCNTCGAGLEHSSGLCGGCRELRRRITETAGRRVGTPPGHAERVERYRRLAHLGVPLELFAEGE